MSELRQLKNSLRDAVGRLLVEDAFLLEWDVKEESISHRVAVYLEGRFAGFNVDCEYNNDLDSESGRKQAHYDQGVGARRATPDVIVHRRGFNGSANNKLIVELKKSGSDGVKIERDRQRLCEFTSEEGPNHLHYYLGALLVIGVKENRGQCTIEWYESGGKTTEEEIRHPM